MAQKKELLHGNIREIFFKYLIPSVGGMMGISLYVLGDTMIVGRGLGSQGLAALNISIPLINVLSGLGLLFGIGGATFMSTMRGRSEEGKVNDIYTKSIIMALLAGVLLTLVRVFFLEELVYFLGASNDTFQMSYDYLGVLMSFSIPFILHSALTVFVRNDGAPQLAMWAMLSGSIINVILDYVFIFIFGWGMAGGALATGLSPVIGLIVLSKHFICKEHKMRLIKPDFNLKIIKRILGNGIASFIVEISAGIVIFAFNKTILSIVGDMGVSAYSIIANLSLIGSAIFIGIGQAIQPIVSFNMGAGKMDRVYESVRLALYTSFIVGVFFWSIGMIFPEFLVSIFTRENSDLMKTTVKGIRIYFAAFLLMGVNITMTTYLQSKEQAKTSMIISLTRGLGLIIILLLIFPKIFGLVGVWITMPLAELITFIISMIVFKKYREGIKYTIKNIGGKLWK